MRGSRRVKFKRKSSRRTILVYPSFLAAARATAVHQRNTSNATLGLQDFLLPTRLPTYDGGGYSPCTVSREMMAANVNELRQRLRKMNDEALVRFGRSAAYLCTPEANHGKAPREAFVFQLAKRAQSGSAGTPGPL
jgi:hypothetical protein